MDKKLTRKEFLLFVGSLAGVFVLSRISGPAPRSPSTSYGSGSYGGTSRT